MNLGLDNPLIPPNKRRAKRDTAASVVCITGSFLDDVDALLKTDEKSESSEESDSTPTTVVRMLDGGAMLDAEDRRNG